MMPPENNEPIDPLLYAKPLFNHRKIGVHTDIAGLTNVKYEQFTNASAHIYRQVIQIFEHFDLKYYLFAGSIVGYVRNGTMPPWMDDIDVMIFEEEIEKFETIVLNALKECGFNVFAPRKWPKGGYHILALQKSGSRDEEIAFTSTMKLKVPWAQVDVFFSQVDEDGFIRNRDGWGQYGKKDVPYNVVEPAIRREICGIEFPIFSQYEAYVEKEYGDVTNNIRVASHNGAILKRQNMNADAFMKSWRHLVETTTGQLPPSVTPELLHSYAPLKDHTYKSKKNESFDEMVMGIITHNADTIFVDGGDGTYWAMDLRRLFPDLKIDFLIENLNQAHRAAHLRDFLNKVSATDEVLERIYHRTVEKLKAYGC